MNFNWFQSSVKSIKEFPKETSCSGQKGEVKGCYVVVFFSHLPIDKSQGSQVASFLKIFSLLLSLPSSLPLHMVHLEV